MRIKGNEKGSITHNPISIDRCCKPFMVEPNISSIKDEIPRAPCNMTKEEFYLKHVRERKSVILRGCQKKWRARKWTFEGTFELNTNFYFTLTLSYIAMFCNVSYSYLGILNRYPAELNITWTTFGVDPSTNERFIGHKTGSDILSRLKRDYSIKVFEKLHTGLKKKYLSKRKSLIYKMDIFEDYTFPQPFPADKFLRLPNGSPDQAYLMLGTKSTGQYR